MTIEQYLRNDFSNIIRKLFLKDRCETCGTSNNLELHHETQFIVLLYETLDDLNLDYKDDISEYTEEQLKLISNLMIGKQMKIKYTTLCKQCHSKIDKVRIKQYDSFKEYHFNLKVLKILEKYY